MRLTNGTNTLDGATYTYDNAGNRTSKANSLNGVTENYSYDNIYQLQQVTQGPSTTEQYTYDPVGNGLTALNSAVWSYNSSNQLTARPGVGYTYDNNGNTLTKSDGTGTTNYSWDAENRLTSVATSGITVSHVYDPFGRRIYKSSSLGTTIYLYDGANIVTELDQNAMVAASYTQGAGIDQPLAMLQAGNVSYYHQDGLGSVTSLTGPAGSVSGSNVYDAFGNTAQSGLGSAFRYTGREFDAEDGLYYYRARYYDPSTSRFLGEDPARYGAGNNFYRYAWNRPTNINDPSGMWPSTTFSTSWTSSEEAAFQAFVQELENTGVSAANAVADAALILSYLVSPTGDNNAEWAKSQGYQYECSRKNRWRCKVRCALINLNTGSAEGYIETIGYGPTEADAFQNGQSFLQNSTPRGFRTKHCHSVGCQKQ